MGPCSPMEELIPLMAKLQQAGAPLPAHPMEDNTSCLVQSLPLRPALLYAGARLHINNTAELSSIIEALSLPRSFRTRRPRLARIFYDSKHAANVCMGTIQSRTNEPLGGTSQQLLLQTQLRMRITMQHIYSHGQNVGDERCCSRNVWLQFQSRH